MTIIVFLYLITEDIDHDINLHSLKLRNFNMKDLHGESLDTYYIYIILTYNSMFIFILLWVRGTVAFSPSCP